jgi:flagellar hook-associated protein 3 FlgL
MVSRVTSASRYDLLVADMQTNLANYNKLTAQLSSGNKLTSLTDDPIAAVNVLNTNRQLGQISTFQTNVGMASAELSALDDFMELATGYLETAWDKAIQANTQTYGDSSLKAIKVEIDELTKTMVDLANSEYNDNYIFAGANTKTVPYTMDDNGNIIYNGTTYDNPDYIRQTEVADGVFEVINTTGDRVFGYYESKEVTRDADGNVVTLNTDDNKYYYEDGTEYQGSVDDLTTQTEETAEGVLGALKLLSNSLQMVLDGDRDAGYELMNSTLDMFSDSLNTITTEQTKFGGVANRLDMSESTLETTSDNLTSYLSDINSVDYAEAITNWLNAQYSYQASLQITAASMNLSLLNYLS